METRAHRHKQFLLAVVLLVLFLPLIQRNTNFVRENNLQGAYNAHPKPHPTLKTLFSGEFQQQYEDWQRDDFGFRHTLVRLHNQIVYSLFMEANGFGLVAGKDGYLYEENYIMAYEGWDFLGDAVIRGRMEKLRALQDSLAKKNVTVIVGLAPGKASYCSEYIPDWWGPPKADNNYRAYAKYLQQLGINHIDFNKWFLQMKPTTTYPLYNNTGIHWSRYGADLALDSLMHYIERKRGIDMPSMIDKKTTWSDTLQFPDNDIGVTMNLLQPIKPLHMAYDTYKFEDTTGRTRPRLLTVADSYFWQMMDQGLSPKAFSTVDFYYYNKNVYHSDGRTPTPVEDANGPVDAGNHDVLFILCTEANLANLGWGFIDEAYDYHVLHHAQSTARMTRAYEQAIRLDQRWLGDVERKANERHIPLDSMIHLDALYMARQDSVKMSSPK